MKWVLKAGLQNALSVLPRPEQANYFFQRRIARSLPMSEATLRRKVTSALNHHAAFLEHARVRPEKAVFYEFGAGWDLAVPLAYWFLGVDRQILVDIRPNLRLELVGDTLRKLERHRAEIEEEAARPLRPAPAPSVASAGELEQRFGIRYLAPMDARDTSLPSESVDFVSSTVTLEHIPVDDVALILRECRRLLDPDGLMSCRIDLRDHYVDFDRRISPFNFLKFSDRMWSLVNSGLHYQNRLRRPDYLRLFEQAGFEIVDERAAKPTSEELERLASMPLAERFRDGYSLEDLGVKSLTVVARPSAMNGRAVSAHSENASTA